MTTCVEAIDPLRKQIFKAIMRIIGSQLTWAMHWAIEIEGTYPELQRVPVSPKPTLSVSCWMSDKNSCVFWNDYAE